MSANNKIRHYRTIKQLTLKELSEKTGVSISAISLIETGKRVPSIVIASKLAEALKVTERDLFPYPSESTHHSA